MCGWGEAAARRCRPASCADAWLPPCIAALACNAMQARCSSSSSSRSRCRPPTCCAGCTSSMASSLRAVRVQRGAGASGVGWPQGGQRGLHARRAAGARSGARCSRPSRPPLARGEACQRPNGAPLALPPPADHHAVQFCLGQGAATAVSGTTNMACSLGMCFYLVAGADGEPGGSCRRRLGCAIRSASVPLALLTAATPCPPRRASHARLHAGRWSHCPGPPVAVDAAARRPAAALFAGAVAGCVLVARHGGGFSHGLLQHADPGHGLPER